jgi:hypothetical protein
MLESVIYLVAGILIICILISLLGKKVDVIGSAAIGASVFFALYVAVACGLVVLGAFSVNRSLMAVDLMSLVALVAVWLVRKRPKPSMPWKPGESFDLLVLLVVLVVVGRGLVNDGFYGMDTWLGVSQAKSMNLVSRDETSPLVAEYLASLDADDYDGVMALNQGLSSKYEGYVVPVVAVLSFGGYFFGVSNMACGFLVLGGCVLTLLWAIFRRKKYMPVLCLCWCVAALALVFAWFGADNPGRVRVSWDELRELDDIISEYDIVVMSPELQEDYYIPVACVTNARVYPAFSPIQDVVEKVRSGGERTYYLTRADISGDLSDVMGINLKNVYSNGTVKLYRVLNFYRTHTSVDNSAFIRSALLVVLTVVATICYMAMYSCIFRKFDAACNLLLSLATVVAVYAGVGHLLVLLGTYDIAFCMAVTLMLGLVVFGILVGCRRKPYYLYDVRKTIGLVPALFICSMVLMKNLDGNLYPYYGTVGSNQLQALRYIYRSGAGLDGIGVNPWLAALMSAMGSVFSCKAMVWVFPVLMDAVVVFGFVVLERLISRINADRVRAVLYGVINVGAVVAAVLLTVFLLGNFGEGRSVVTWSTLEAYAAVVEPDDAIAIQRSAYSTYGIPVQVMTGVHRLVEAEDYEDAAARLDNYGKDTYYITSEIMDPTYNRLNIIAHMDGEYMYRFYDYLTKRGIYSVADSVVQGFHDDKDTSGMAWTSDQNAFIQVDIPYGKYDTVRLYLGDRVKLEEINIEYIELEFRENWHYVSTARIDSDNNGTYIDFKLDNTYLVDGYNVIYFHSGAMWSPLIYGDKDIRVMGFPFLYLQFMNLGDSE